MALRPGRRTSPTWTGSIRGGRSAPRAPSPDARPQDVVDGLPADGCRRGQHLPGEGRPRGHQRSPEPRPHRREEQVPRPGEGHGRPLRRLLDGPRDGGRDRHYRLRRGHQDGLPVGAGRTPDGLPRPAQIEELIFSWTEKYKPSKWVIEKNAFQLFLTRDEEIRAYRRSAGVP